MAHDVSIIIINLNNKTFLEKCLVSLDKYTPADTEIIVVDNASGDGSPEMVKKNYPEILLIQNKKNEGVSRSRNMAVNTSRGKYILFFDADTEIRSNVVAGLSNYLDTYPQTGIIGPKLVYPDGRLQHSCRTFPSPLTFLLRGIGAQEDNKYLSRHLMTDYDHNTIRPVDWILCACFMIRRETFEKLGGFDESYFYGYEEIDLCFRAGLAGWETVYFAKETVTHYYQRRSAHGGILNPFKWWHAYCAAKFFLLKYRPRANKIS